MQKRSLSVGNFPAREWLCRLLAVLMLWQVVMPKSWAAAPIARNNGRHTRSASNSASSSLAGKYGPASKEVDGNGDPAQIVATQTASSATNSPSPAELARINKFFAARAKKANGNRLLAPGAAFQLPGDTAVVRHAAALNGGKVEGTIRQLLGEGLNINSGIIITGDLIVPGSPNINNNGPNTYDGTVVGTGSSSPSGYSINLNSNTTLRHIVTRTDAISISSVPAPPTPTGTRDVSLNAGQSAGDFATLRNLTLNSNYGTLTVPPGTYGNFIAGSGSTLVFGVANQATTYNLQELTLNSNSNLQIQGAVTINVLRNVNINGPSTVGSIGSTTSLAVNISTGNFTLNSSTTNFYGVVKAPSGSVSINSGCLLQGLVVCDRLFINGNGILRGFATDIAAPTITIDSPAEDAIIRAATVTVTGTINDDSAAYVRVNAYNAVVNGNTYTATVPINLGANTLTVVATDAFGNTSQLTRNISRADATNQPPAVNAGANQTVTMPAAAVLNGTATDDGLPAGSTLTKTWTKVSGPGTVNFSNANAASTTATFSAAGTYVLNLRASDGQLSANSNVTIEVNPPANNQAPVVNAGTDQTITLPDTASLSGTATDDGLPTGSSLTLTWSKLSGPGTVTFSNLHSATTTATFSTAGTYVLKLTATDSALTASDNIQIIVSPAPPDNQAPVVNAGADQAITLPANATLNGTATDDGLPTGSTLTKTWSKVSGPGTVTFANANAASTTASFSAAGEYLLRLTASDSELTSSDDVIVSVDPAQPTNQAPSVNAGADQTITLPAGATLQGTVTDDGLPTGSTLTITWSKLSGPGTVTFANANSANTTATFSVAGNYVLRLTASDSELTSTDQLTITVNAAPPTNQAPVVNAGADQTITLPAFATLNGTATDDGLPTGSSLTISWSKISGPGTVTFANANSASTTATFSVAGTYTLRLAATDSALTSSDDVTIIVEPAPPTNQAPVVNAGADQSISFEGNLIKNGGNEAALVNGEIANWTEVTGNDWTQAAAGTNQFPASLEGNTYFTAGDVESAELSQLVDVSALATKIDAGTQKFDFRGYVRSALESPADAARIVVEYLDANSAVLTTFDSGPITSTADWQLISDLRVAPSGTRSVRIRLIAARNSGTSNDAFFDKLSLRPATAALSTLQATVTDDGLPTGATLSINWSKVSGPGNVTFSTPTQATTQARFDHTGTYVLRVTADDSELNSSDEVTITVAAGNQAPTVNAGADQTVTLPNNANLQGEVSDDGLPVGNNLSINWSKVSGPGTVTFANANQASTTASFSVDGVYTLRLSASDGELSSNDEIVITVNPVPVVNSAPIVNAGADQTITLPATALLNGSATDDGLPTGSTLSYSWSKLSGSGTVIFANPNSAATEASFSAPGTYTLRLTVTDSALSGTDDIVITVNPAPPQNQPPTVNAGADQTISLPTRSVTLTATASDDGLPTGSSVTVTWSQVSGPCQAVIGSVNQLSTAVTFAAAGTYTFRATASDSVLSATDDVVIHVLAEGGGVNNRAPIVDAGPDQQTRLNLTITLSGTALDDGLPNNTLTYAWSKISGPNGVINFGTPTQATTTVSFGTPGNYLLRLTVSDGQLQTSDYLAVKVLPNNEGPHVYAGPNQSLSTAIAQLSGRAFDDEFPLGRVLTYSWTKISGPGTVSFSNPNSLNTTASFSSVGSYLLFLSVSDGALTSSSDITIGIGSPGVNQAPIVSGGPDQVVRLPQVATLQGSVVDDGLPGASHLTNSWTSISGPAAVTIVYGSEDRTVANVEFTAPGTYVLRFSSTDSQLTSSDDVTVVVTASANVDLTAGSLSLSNVTINGQTLAFQANAQVSVTNTGGTDITDSFTVKFFEDRNGNGQFDVTDNVLGTATLAGITAQTVVPVSAVLQGTLLFHSNLIFAFVDADNVVTEDSETNNLANTTPPCTFQPSTGAFAPRVKWSWSGSAIFPDEAEVTVAPVVADLNGDGIADIIFITIKDIVDRADGFPFAHLRAINGNNGTELFTVTSRYVMGTGGIAVGDIDRDGRPEIICVDGINPDGNSPNRLVAFNHDGSFKWLSAPTEIPSIELGAPAIADLDQDGLPEIIFGRQVFNGDGTLRWTGVGGRGSFSTTSPLSIAVDLDLDGKPEIVAGNTAYRANGTLFWQNTALPDGFTAIGNFDSDPYPEIVLVASSLVNAATPGKLYLLEHDGTIKWGPITLAVNGGGAPLVADLDGDGIPEIGIAGRTKYMVYDAAGNLKWTTTTSDFNSGITGATAFDFNGDGKVEVVYSDESKLRILRGTDGVVLYEATQGSWTGVEYPVVVDVDGDGKAEIVAVVNQLFTNPGPVGIFVYEDTADQWVVTRPIWNEHSYHITNVNDDGTIPVKEQNSLEVFNGFRAQALASGCAYSQPDLIASYVRRSTVGQQIKLTVRIGNGGSIAVGSDVPVSFYNGDPSNGGALLGTVRTSQYLTPGKFEDVSILMPQETIALPIWVVADDQGGLHGIVNESSETNNRYNSNLFLSPLANHAPIVNAGPDQTKPLSTVPVILAGEVHDDGFPLQTYTVFWGVVNGPGPVTFEDATNAATSATFTVAGTYVLRLTADDGELVGKDELIVTINALNQAPIVNAGTDLAIKLNQSATLNGEVSDDNLPTNTLTISWSKLSGAGTVTFANAAIKQTTATFSAAGTYVLKLDASDGELQSSDTVTVTVNAASDNQAPTVNAGADQSITLPIDTLQINAQVSDDGNPNNSVQLSWQQISGPATVTFGNLQQSGAVTASFTQAGSYTLRLTANDGDLSSSDDVVVTVNAAGANQAPVVNAGADQTITLPTNSVTLSGTVSDDNLPSGAPLTISWTSVSGPAPVTLVSQSATVVTASFTLAGVYTFRLNASDSKLASSDDVTVTVISTSPAPTVEILSPLDGDEITKPINIVGNISGGSWKLEYALNGNEDFTAGNQPQFTTFAIGSGAVSNATIASFDTTMLLNGTYTVRLSTLDASSGQIALSQFSVVVARQLKVGNFSVTFDDLTVPVTGVPIQVTRSYDSRDNRVGDFGVGWTLDLKSIRVEKSTTIGRHWSESFIYNGPLPQYNLDPLRPHLVTVTFPDGKVYKFRAVTNPSQLVTAIAYPAINFVPEAGTVGKLEVLDQTDLRVVGIPSSPGTARVEIVNLIGSTAGQPYNPELFKFTTAEGVEFVVHERFGLQSVKDTSGNTITISATGITHTNDINPAANKSVTFVRDTQGRITRITDPRGNPLQYTYDTNGNLISFKDAENNITGFSYDGNHKLLNITDPRNITPIRNEYDTDGRLVKHTDAFGKTINYDHQIGARREIITDRLGHPTTFDYDERGNVLKQTDALGAITTYTYNDNDNTLTETNALGKTTSYTYDNFDNKLSETDSLGNTTRYTYNSRRQVLTITDAKGAVTTNTYHPKGYLLSTKNPLGNITTFTYDAEGRQLTLTDARNNTTTFEYDTFGHVTKQTNALGAVTTSTYDQNGNRLTQTENRTVNGAPQSFTTFYTYDKLNRLTVTTYTETNGASVTSRTEYNAIGKISRSINQLNRVTSYTYDDMGQLLSITSPDNSTAATTYDAEGRRITSTDRAGRVTSFTYDEVGRLTKTTYSDSTIITSTYDQLGRIITSTDALGHTTTYEYDPNCGCSGRRTKVTDALGNTTSSAFDQLGNQISVTDANNRTTFFDYDLNNRQVRVRYPDNTQYSTQYDELGRRVSQTDQAGRTTHFEYDKVGRLVKVIDALNQETAYTYDEVGNQLTQTDALGRTTRYQYDSLHRRTSRTLPLGQQESYSYDIAGNLLQRNNFNGSNIVYAYDSLNRLIKKDLPGSTTLNTGKQFTYTYTTSGRLATVNDTSLSDNTSTIVYSYDNRDRLIRKQTANGTLTYSYDATGNLLSVRSSNAEGIAEDFGYDVLNRLQTVTDQRLGTSSNVTAYEYDNVGNLAKVSLPNEVESIYQYNSLNRLTNLSIKHGTTQLNGYSYTLGAAGNRLSVAELSGRVAQYSYDSLYRLTSEAVSGASNPTNNGIVNYNYDKVGNRLQRNSTASAVPVDQHTYDNNDRLTSDSYFNDGSTKQSGNRKYEYDAEGHLIIVRDSSTDTELIHIVYDANGNRFSKTVTQGGTTTTTKYLVDTNNLTGYSQVVEELQTVNGTSAVVRQYSYGHDLISQRQLINGNRIASFYLYDGHGSVRCLADVNGNITDTYDYDAFGILINQTGTTPNNYLYAGEQWDSDLGMYYLRARYLNVNTGRFWSMDDYEGANYDPQTLHKYLYVGSNPTNSVDPSGKRSLLEASIVSGLIGAIAGGIATRSVYGAAKGLLIGLFAPVVFAGIAYGGGIAIASIAQLGFGVTVTEAVGVAISTNVLQSALGIYAAYSAYNAKNNDERISIVVALILSVIAGRYVPKPPASPDVVFSGHGTLPANAGTTVVPQGTTFITYAGRGNAITDELGNLIEIGNAPKGLSSVEVFKAGDPVPNYVLEPPTNPNLYLRGTPQIVSKETPLSDLLQPNMGVCHWAACQVTPGQPFGVTGSSGTTAP